MKLVHLQPSQAAKSRLFEPPLIDFSVLWSGHRLIAPAVGEFASLETGINCLCLMAFHCSRVIKFKCVCVHDHSVGQMVLKQIKSSFED